VEGRGGAVNAGKGRGGGAVNAGAAQVSRMQVGTEATGALASISSSTRLNDIYYKNQFRAQNVIFSFLGD